MFMEARCGAWQLGGDSTAGGLEFRVFFPAGVEPGVTALRAAGDFQRHLGGADWDFDAGVPLVPEPAADARGTFWSGRTNAMLPSGFYEYMYVVEFDTVAPRYVTDPCARYGGLHGQNSGVVVGGTTPADNLVRPLVGGPRPLSDLIVYELMIDDFTAEYRAGRAPLAAVVDRLDHLVGLGINAVLFMPWTAWKHQSFDWGYEPFQYFAVEARYANEPGRPAEKLSLLKRLVSECHDRGIHVLMDGVYNHVSTEFPYKQLYRDPDTCPFTAQTFVKSFPGLQDLDFSHPMTGELVKDVCRYWMDTVGIDGIRFDNTVNFYLPGALDGLPEVLDDAAQHAARRGVEHFSLTLEHLDLSAADVTNDTAATSFWDNSLHEVAFTALWDGHIDSRFLNALNNRRHLSAGKVPTLYLSNHDHSQIAWQAGARQNAGAIGHWWKIQPFLIALFTSTAVPMLHNGQELGEEHHLPEDDAGTRRRVSPRPLRWQLRDDPIGQVLHALHATLARIRHEHPALRSAHMYPSEWAEWQTQPNPVGVGVDVRRQTVVYHRWASVDGGVDNVVVVLNFSGTDQSVDVPFPVPGTWTDLLAGFHGGAGWSTEVDGPRAPVPVGSHWGRVLHRFNPTG